MTRNLLVEQALDELANANVLPRLDVEARDFAWEDDYEKPFKRDQTWRRFISLNIILFISLLIIASFIMEDAPLKQASFNKGEDDHPPFLSVLRELFYHIAVFLELAINVMIRKTIIIFSILQSIGSVITSTIAWIFKFVVDFCVFFGQLVYNFAVWGGGIVISLLNERFSGTFKDIIGKL